MLPLESLFERYFIAFLIAIGLSIPAIVGLVGIFMCNLKLRKMTAKISDIYDKTSKIYKRHEYYKALSCHNFDEHIWLDIISTLFVSVSLILVLSAIITYYSADVSTYNQYVYNYNINTEYVNYCNNSIPKTKLEIEEAERYNRNIKNCVYYSDEWKNNPDHYVNTDVMWARFCNKIDAKRTEDIVR